MLTVSAFGATTRHFIFPVRSSSLPKHFPNFSFHIRCLPFHETPTAMAPSTSSTPKVVAEYAKSNRSSCKKCSKTIAAKAPRLGLVTRDARGFDMTKWHHLECLPINSDLTDSFQKINGFSSLESKDQEALKKLVEECKKSSEEKTNLVDEVTELDSKTPNKFDKRKSSQEVTNDEEETGGRSPKKLKAATPVLETELDMTLSASDIKDKYRDAELSPKWKAFQTIIFLERDEGLRDSEKIAAFDFDGTLAKTNVRRTGADAWSLMYSSIPDKLQSLYNDGYKLVIFTNESNIDRWKNKRQVAVDSKVGRLNNFIDRVKVPIQVFISCGIAGDSFRKPKTGMWKIMKEHFNSGIPIDKDKSFYVGDAAGRPEDHSDADIKFAQDLGLKFYVPEEYFEP